MIYEYEASCFVKTSRDAELLPLRPFVTGILHDLPLCWRRDMFTRTISADSKTHVSQKMFASAVELVIFMGHISGRKWSKQTLTKNGSTKLGHGLLDAKFHLNDFLYVRCW